jgi:hypothetical protein
VERNRISSATLQIFNQNVIESWTLSIKGWKNVDEFDFYFPSLHNTSEHHSNKASNKTKLQSKHILFQLTQNQIINTSTTMPYPAMYPQDFSPKKDLRNNSQSTTSSTASVKSVMHWAAKRLREHDQHSKAQWAVYYNKTPEPCKDCEARLAKKGLAAEPAPEAKKE